jgi:glyoxylase-like metal-dependent hydrolase (beta-lactamase superfamily II)
VTPTSVSAVPVELPLAGGQPGATVAVSPLLSGEALGPPGWFERESGPLAGLKAVGVGVPRDQWLRVPVIAFLVEHPSVGPILIDTGLDRAAVDAPRRQLGPINGLMLRGLRLTPEDTVPAQLRARGLEPADVRLIVMTHLHFDHASGLPGFPGATVVVSEAEWKAATAPRSFLAGYNRAHLDPALTYQTLNLADDGAGWGPFNRTLDLFGDDSVRLAYTPGHSAGHLSVLVRVGDRYVLIAGDAIYTMDTLRRGRRPFRSVDSAAFERSVAELEAFDREHQDAIIIPGHDMALWEGLAERYV